MIKNAVNSALQNKNAVMFITAMFFISGILSYFNDSAIVCSYIISFIAIIAIIKNLVPLRLILLWIIIFYIGFFNSYFRISATDMLVSEVDKKVTIKGQIVSIPNISGNYKTKFFFKVSELDGKKVSGKTFVTVTSGNKNNFETGNFYEMNGKLKTPFKVGNPSQFDYGKYLKNFDTFTLFYVTDCKQIKEKLSLKWKFLQKMNKFRDKIISVHSKYLKSPNLEILGGIVFGDDAVASPDYIKTSFINSGLLHILAASGMNVAFIYGFWVFFMRRIKAPFKLSIISGMLIIVLYTLMTGLGASLIRAALMLLLILIGKLIDRDANSVSLLALVAMLMLIYNPSFINDIGFQLSFIVTFGILTTANVVFEKFKDSNISECFIGAVLIPVVAQIWVAPIQIFYFNTFSTYSIFANVLSIPFLSIVSSGGFLSTIFAVFAPLTDKICMVFDFALNYILHIIVFISNFFANLPFAKIIVSHPNIFQIILYYAEILLLTFSLKAGFSKKILSIAIILPMMILVSLIRIPSKNVEIIAFDVQNADCFLIKSPANKYFIIDTGRGSFKGSKAQANSIIIKYIKDNGIRDIEGMIITHFDNDHSGGASDIMENLKIKRLYLNSFDDKSLTSKSIYDTIDKLNINTTIPENNTIIYTENNFSLKTYRAKSNKDNERSIITLLSSGDFDMLFTGDAGVEAFTSLKTNLPRNVEVLKVGHHGGFGVVNDDMLKYLNNEVSIISTGPNSFGHPVKGTLDVLRNTEIYRTDRHNSIKITSDGQIYSVYLYSPEKHKYIFSKDFKSKD